METFLKEEERRGVFISTRCSMKKGNFDCFLFLFELQKQKGNFITTVTKGYA
ncbi:hypothetical protein AtNW77_Chr4g0313581 [Arabidopsis thaliana]